MMVIDNKFEIGQTVYMKTDIDQSARIIVGIYVYYNCLRYDVSKGEASHYCFDFQLSAEKDVLKQVTS